jgi:alpha-mannosidase
MVRKLNNGGKMKIEKKLIDKLKNENYFLQDELERFNSQIKFAEEFSKLHPENKKTWKTLILQAIEKIETLPSLTDYNKLKAAVRDAEDILMPISNEAKKYNIHCVSHAHIDMNWMWSWPETVAVTNDTFETVLKLLDEYPDFIFSQSQASVYKIVEDYNPEMLKKIQKHVANGRWEITASHWVEGDKNLISGESLTRHLLYTRKYMKELFKLTPEDVNIDWAPDTFGHASTVPSYLNKGGVKYCYLHRPGDVGSKRPKAFWWTSKDGSKILVRNDMVHAYNGIISSEIATNLIDFVKDTKGKNYMYVYGVGDHGGGPTRCDLNRIVAMQDWPIFPTVKFSKTKTFFEQLENEGAELPVLSEELNFEFTGCYTTQTQIKKANRLSENRLTDAELAATLAWSTLSADYPVEKINRRWEDCLFNHFHDILPGSGVRDTRDYTMGLFQQIAADTSMIETLSFRKLASVIDTSECSSFNQLTDLPPTFYSDSFGAGVGIKACNGNISSAEKSSGRGCRPFVLFNTTAVERKEVVEITVWDNPIPEDNTLLKDRKFSVKNPKGKILPAQYISDGDAWGHRFVKLAFPISLKGFSYALYTIIEEETFNTTTNLKKIQEPHICVYATHERHTRFGCENEFINLEINPKTGAVLRLFDKKAKLDIISPEIQAPLMECSVERPHNMSAWVIDYADKIEIPTIKNISYITDGPHKIGIKVDAEHKASKFSIIYEVHQNSPQVNIKVNVTWLENGDKTIGCPVLRMPFALNLDSAEATYEIPFGSIERSLNSDEEVPTLQWIKVSGNIEDEKAGCVLLNDSKYGYSLDENILIATLIRSSYEPDPHPELGEHEINFALLPFNGKLSDSAATGFGQNFNHPVRIIGTDIHEGKLPTASNFIKIENPKVIVSGIKKAENENAIIIRLYELEGKKQKTEIALNENLFAKIQKAEIVDLMERKIKDIKVNGNDVAIEIPPFSIISVKLIFHNKHSEQPSRTCPLKLK